MATDICLWVGQRIRTLRMQRGWTQQILADHASLSRETISAIENGRMEPGLMAMWHLAQALEVGMEEFFHGS